jgi:MFS family permease
VLIAWVGAVGTLWATAVAFAVSAVASAAIRLPHADAPLPHERPRGLLRSTAEGLRFVWHDRLLRTITVLYTLIVGVYLPVEGVILPVHFEVLDQPAALGLVITAMGAGGVVGSLAYGAWGHGLPRRRLFVGALVATSVGLLGMAVLPPLGVLMVFGALVGLAFGPVNPLANLVMQVRTPERLRGRVVGVLTSTGYAAGPVGYLLAGPLVEAVGVRTAFLGLALAIVGITASSAVLPSLHDLDDPAFDIEPEPGEERLTLPEAVHPGT